MRVFVCKVLVATAICATAAVLVTARQTAPQGLVPDRVPAAWKPLVQRAEAAFVALQGSLMRRLQEATRDGPAAALDVCRLEAGAIRDRVVREQGVTVGRTSHALRNARNAPPPWAATLVAAAAGRPAREQQQQAFDLGDRLGVIRPIPMGMLCGNCHGPVESLASDVRDAIARDYPGDRATGFREGDVRGWIWAEVPKGATP